MNTEQRNALKAAALAADTHGHHIYTNPRDSGNWSANEDYIAAANPAAILSLITAVESAEAELQALRLQYVSDFGQQQDAAPQPVAVPEGWKLVPVEPTDEMRLATKHSAYADHIDEDWKAMLAAAPAAPSPAVQPAQAQGDAKPMAYHVKFGDFTHFSGAITGGREYVEIKKPTLDTRFFEGCDSLLVTPLYAAQPAVQQDAVRWQPIETAPKDGTHILVWWEGKTRLAWWLDNSKTRTPWAGWKVPSLQVMPFGSVPTHWMPLPAAPIDAAIAKREGV